MTVVEQFLPGGIKHSMQVLPQLPARAANLNDEIRRPAQPAPDLRKSTDTTLAPGVICLANHAGVVVGLPLRGVRTPFGQSGSLHGLELVPSKWRPLVPGERREGVGNRRVFRTFGMPVWC